jgi:hypothetical protein
MLTNAPPAAGSALAPPPPPTPLTAVARWLAERAAFEDDAVRALCLRAPDPDALVAALAAEAKHAEAVQLVARALPKREAVWWAFIAARHAHQRPSADAPAGTPGTVAPAVQHALDAVERWIAAPADSTRHAAFEAAQAAGADTPAGCVGMAVFLSGGSLAGPAVPVHVPPPAGACWQLVAGAVLLAAVGAPPAQIAAAFQGYVAQGVEIVRRLGGWEASATLARQAYEHDAQLAAQAKAQAAGGAAAPTA